MSCVSEALGRNRKLMLTMMCRPHRRWGIPANMLIRENRQ